MVPVSGVLQQEEQEEQHKKRKMLPVVNLPPRVARETRNKKKKKQREEEEEEKKWRNLSHSNYPDTQRVLFLFPFLLAFMRGVGSGRKGVNLSAYICKRM